MYCLKKSQKYWICNVICIALCYGFALCTNSIGVDDENILRSLNGRLIETGRFGLNIINTIFKITPYLPFFYLFLCLFLLAIATCWVVNLYQHVSEGSFNEKQAIIFSALILTYPGFAYKFIFNQNLLQMGLVFLAQSISAITLYQLTYEDDSNRVKIRHYFVLFGSIIFILYNYETGLVAVGIIFLFAVLYSMNYKEILNTKVLKRCIPVGVCLLLDIVVWKVSQIVVLKILEIEMDSYIGHYLASGEIQIKIQNMLEAFRSDLCNHSLIWMVQVLIVVYAFVYCLRHRGNNRKRSVCLIFAGILFLAIFMQIVSLNYYCLPRTTLYLAWFYAPVVCVILQGTLGNYVLTYGVVFILLYYNAQYINTVNYTDYLVCQLDLEKAKDIYQKITSMGMGYKEKPTVFIGASNSYELPFEIDTGIDSIFRHDITSYNNRTNESVNFRIYSYFKMLGMPLIEADDVLYDKCLIYNNQMEAFPSDNSVYETDDAIIVKLGECSQLSLIDISDFRVYDTDSLNCIQDSFELSDDKVLHCSGWLYIKGKPVNQTKKVLIFENQGTNETWRYYCADLERADVPFPWWDYPVIIYIVVMKVMYTLVISQRGIIIFAYSHSAMGLFI